MGVNDQRDCDRGHTVHRAAIRPGNRTCKACLTADNQGAPLVGVRLQGDFGGGYGAHTIDAYEWHGADLTAVLSCDDTGEARFVGVRELVARLPKDGR